MSGGAAGRGFVKTGPEIRVLAGLVGVDKLLRTDRCAVSGLGMADCLSTLEFLSPSTVEMSSQLELFSFLPFTRSEAVTFWDPGYKNEDPTSATRPQWTLACRGSAGSSGGSGAHGPERLL